MTFEIFYRSGSDDVKPGLGSSFRESRCRHSLILEMLVGTDKLIEGNLDLQKKDAWWRLLGFSLQFEKALLST